MKKVLARCLVLALALCLVCSSCFAEAGYEAIKEYIDNESAVDGISFTSSGDPGKYVVLGFAFEGQYIYLYGVNAQGEEESTLWYPSISVFLKVMEKCVGHWDELFGYLSDGGRLIISIWPTAVSDPLSITDADTAKEIYDILFIN